MFGLLVNLSRDGDLGAYTTHSMTKILAFPKAHVILTITAYDKPFILIILRNLHTFIQRQATTFLQLQDKCLISVLGSVFLQLMGLIVWIKWSYIYRLFDKR